MIIAASEASGRLSARASLLRAVASLLTTAIERLHYVEVANRSEIEIQSERLRSGILAALSHDVRTPLTAMYGLADTLASDTSLTAPNAHEAAVALRDQALQLNGMVTNLLDLARMQAGHVTLRREWQPLDEVIGASIRFAAPALKSGKVSVNLAPDLPLVNIDAVLIERVLCNLLENAAKYSPEHADIRLDANVVDERFEVSISNAGKGFPPDRLEQVFTLFERGPQDGHTSGMGVGLAICRAIVEAHGGHICASNPPGGGARVTFTLARGTPPLIDLDSGAVTEGAST
jgi:two-component system sensor histidine kinase KdpD